MIIYDISVPLYEGMPQYPGDPELRITQFEAHERGDAWTTSQLTMCAHTGTHVDAPRHRIPGGRGIDALDLSALIGPAYVVDLTTAEKVIEASDLEAAAIPAEARRLLLKTRNGELWERTGYQREHAALGGGAAEWMVARGIRLTAFDYLSADVYDTTDFPAHNTLLGAGVVIVEGVNLQGVKGGWYTLLCLPLKIRDGDGAPARAVLVRQ